MSIVITVAHGISAKTFTEIERFALQLTKHDENFKGRTIEVRRGAATVVNDELGLLRQALLQLMVETLVASAE